MSKVRTEPPVRHAARNRVAIDARGSVEYAPTLCGFEAQARVRVCRPLLFAHPAVEIGPRIHHHPQEHLRVLRSAVLSALAQEEPGLMRVDPRVVRVIRDKVRFARQPWYPETVVCV